MKKILFFAFLLLCIGCKNKRELSPSEFQKKAEQKGYTIQDVTDKYDIETTTTVLLALHKDYEIEYHKLKTKKGSISTYNMLKQRIEKQKDKKSIEKNMQKNNGKKYTLETEKTYTVLSKIDTTILYTTAPIEHKKMVEEDIKAMGY